MDSFSMYSAIIPFGSFSFFSVTNAVLPMQHSYVTLAQAYGEEVAVRCGVSKLA